MTTLRRFVSYRLAIDAATVLGYLFTNVRASRVKLLVHDGFGVWCCARRLNTGSFVWAKSTDSGAVALTLTQQQFDALVVGLPWQRLPQSQVITRM